MRQIKDVQLKPKEYELLEAVENGEYELVMTEARRDELKVYARRTLRQNLDAEQNDSV
jgi:hypothetical protein